MDRLNFNGVFCFVGVGILFLFYIFLVCVEGRKFGEIFEGRGSWVVWVCIVYLFGEFEDLFLFGR